MNESISGDEAREIASECVLLVMRRHSRVRIDGAASIVAHLFLKDDDPEKLTFNEQSFFVRVLDSVSTPAFGVLSYLWRLDDQRDIQNLIQKHLDISGDWARTFVAELERYGLVRVERVQVGPNFVVMTDVGRLFVERVMNWGGDLESV